MSKTSLWILCFVFLGGFWFSHSSKWVARGGGGPNPSITCRSQRTDRDVVGIVDYTIHRVELCFSTAQGCWGWETRDSIDTIRKATHTITIIYKMLMTNPLIPPVYSNLYDLYSGDDVCGIGWACQGYEYELEAHEGRFFLDDYLARARVPTDWKRFTVDMAHTHTARHHEANKMMRHDTHTHTHIKRRNQTHKNQLLLLWFSALDVWQAME